MLKSTSIKALLIKSTSLKHSLFGNNKAPQSLYGQNKIYKNLEFNKRPVNVPASEVASFPKGAENYKAETFWIVKTQNFI